MWPKKITLWIDDRVLYMSIPFTWLAERARMIAVQGSFEFDTVVVGGPGVYLMPDTFSDLPHVSVEYSMPGVLQRVNPEATRTTTGCPNKCGFCGVSKIEPVFAELNEWPDLPVICDNNILAASSGHFDRVCDRLERWGWCDFNQGIDARLLTPYHAERFKRIGKPILRLAFDNPGIKDTWVSAYETLRAAKISKRQIRSYCLVGFRDDPEVAWNNCMFVESFKIKALPMWYHALDSLSPNTVTHEQLENGWNDYERRRIMQWFYQHKKAVRAPSLAQEPPPNAMEDSETASNSRKPKLAKSAVESKL